jgi:phosphatidylserine decarboxylase
MTETIIQSAKKRGNKVMFTVIYLAPQDYHRYHSPAYFTANYRRHIAGYLEPVKPEYIMKHKDVLKDNERVNVLGEWAHGFFTISFIGALNVGSIRLLFDEDLKTNLSSPK